MSKDAYHDPARWANDLHALIQATGADRPCVVAWSYGGRLLNGHLSIFGDGGLGALNYVAATSIAERFGLGRSYALIVPMPSDDPETAARGTEDQISAPARSEYTHSRIPGSTLSIFKGAGHATLFEED